MIELKVVKWTPGSVVQLERVASLSVPLAVVKDLSLGTASGCARGNRDTSGHSPSTTSSTTPLKAPPASGLLTMMANVITPQPHAIVSHGRLVSMTNVRLNALKTPTAPMATIATTAAGASRIRDAQKTSSVLVLMLFVTSLPMRTASTVTAQQTAQRAAPQMPTVQDLIPSVETEDLSTFADATPTKTARLARFVTQETWTEMATTRSVFRMVAISWMITALAMMLSVTSLTMRTASTVTSLTMRT